SRVPTRTRPGRVPRRCPHAANGCRGGGRGRGALLAAALTLAPVALLPATHDVLHQPYRAALMPETGVLVTRLRESGLAAVVSGAGPTVLVLAVDDDQRAAALAAAPAGWWAAGLDVASGATATLVPDPA
ncbi:homoserine kinase, partial [Jatrophihabitans sp. YIM 134969]